MKFCIKIIFVLCILSLGCKESTKENVEETKNYAIYENDSYTIKGVMNHNSNYFTEGLFFDDGMLYESMGSPDELPFTNSQVGILDTNSGNLFKTLPLDNSKYFAEGSSIIGDNLYLLTYKNQLCFVINKSNFQIIDSFYYDNKEGWGLTTDGNQLIMSDGTEKVTFIDAGNYKKRKEINVRDKENNKVLNINELEYCNGFIYANIFGTNTIIKIDTATGNSVAQYNFDGLFNLARNNNINSMEMNGIAFNGNTNEFYLTGKFWPYIFRVQLKPSL